MFYGSTRKNRKLLDVKGTKKKAKLDQDQMILLSAAFFGVRSALEDGETFDHERK